MRRLAAAIVACLLMPLAAIPVVAYTETTITTNITVGAGHTLPSGAWGFSDGCQTGIASGQEYRCAFEFDISAMTSNAKVVSAVLSIRRSGGCATNDCPVDIYSYTGNGSADLGDVLGGSNVVTWTPNSTTAHQWNVTGYIQAHATAGHDWAGFRLSHGSGNTAVQDYDISSGTRVSLAVSYFSQPVDVQIYLSGSGEGANGSVTSSPAGIDCGSTCLATFEYGSPVTLTAHPASTAVFGSWQGGPCDGSTNPVCEFIVPALNVEAGANFLGKPATNPPTAAPTARPTTKPSTPSTPKPTTPATTAPGATSAPTSAPSGPFETATATDLASSSPETSPSPDAGVSPGASPGATAAPAAPAADAAGLPIIPIMLFVAVVLIGGVVIVTLRGRRVPAAAGIGGDPPDPPPA